MYNKLKTKTIDYRLCPPSSLSLLSGRLSSNDIAASSLGFTDGRGGLRLGGGTGGGAATPEGRLGRAEGVLRRGEGNARTALQGSHTLTGFSLSIPGIVFLPFEHLSQTMFPHLRQWCLRTNSENSVLHLLHNPDVSSGLQIGAVGWATAVPLGSPAADLNLFTTAVKSRYHSSRSWGVLHTTRNVMPLHRPAFTTLTLCRNKKIFL